MKTSEFKRIIKNCELYTGDLDAASRISLGDSDFGNYDVAYISPNDQWIFSIQPCFCHIKPKYIHTVWQAIFDYAATPIAERKDEPHFFVRLFPLRYSINSCLSDDEGISTTNANIFTPSTYAEFIRTHSEWKPFLKDYDPDNKTVFVPVEVSK